MRISLLIGVLLSGAVLSHAQVPDLAKGDGAGDLAQLRKASVPQQDSKNQGAKNHFDQLPQGWHVDLNMPLKLPQDPTSKAASQLQSSPIDPGSIKHPSQARLGAISPATPVMQKLYPGLTFLPVNANHDKQEAKLEAIPTKWPLLKIDAIPRSWPDLETKKITRESTSEHKPDGEDRSTDYKSLVPNPVP